VPIHRSQAYEDPSRRHEAQQSGVRSKVPTTRSRVLKKDRLSQLAGRPSGLRGKLKLTRPGHFANRIWRPCRPCRPPLTACQATPIQFYGTVTAGSPTEGLIQLGGGTLRPLVLKPMLNSGFGCRPCSDTVLRWLTVFLICALSALSAPCWTAGAPTPPAVQMPFIPSFCDQGCAIADLDGDGRPDFVIAKAEGWGPSGFKYRIDLDLTSRAGLSSFSVSAQRGGLRIIPRDVNGDWDLDLVITSAWSFTPVGVWINDGHGRFTRGDPTAYPKSTWDKVPTVLSETPHEPFQATLPEFSRSWFDSSQGSSFYNKPIIERLTPLLAVLNPASGSPRRPQTRGPPFPLEP
jgi:hypothetical protein